MLVGILIPRKGRCYGLSDLPAGVDNVSLRNLGQKECQKGIHSDLLQAEPEAFANFAGCVLYNLL